MNKISTNSENNNNHRKNAHINFFFGTIKHSELLRCHSHSIFRVILCMTWLKQNTLCPSRLAFIFGDGWKKKNFGWNATGASRTWTLACSKKGSVNLNRLNKFRRWFETSWSFILWFVTWALVSGGVGAYSSNAKISLILSLSLCISFE